MYQIPIYCTGHCYFSQRNSSNTAIFQDRYIYSAMLLLYRRWLPLTKTDNLKQWEMPPLFQMLAFKKIDYRFPTSTTELKMIYKSKKNCTCMLTFCTGSIAFICVYFSNLYFFKIALRQVQVLYLCKNVSLLQTVAF